MKKKYNLALVPTTQSKEIVRLAATFSPLSHQYCLGKHSLPHVTLYQFHFIETEIAYLWQEISSIWRQEMIELSFKEFSLTGSVSQIFWLALLPNERARLQGMHHMVANFLTLPIKLTFDPHMTLLNSQKKAALIAAKVESEKNYHPIADRFVLALGESDAVGQLTKIIYQNKIA